MLREGLPLSGIQLEFSKMGTYSRAFDAKTKKDKAAAQVLEQALAGLTKYIDSNDKPASRELSRRYGLIDRALDRIDDRPEKVISDNELLAVMDESQAKHNAMRYLSADELRKSLKNSAGHMQDALRRKSRAGKADTLSTLLAESEKMSYAINFLCELEPPEQKAPPPRRKH